MKTVCRIVAVVILCMLIALYLPLAVPRLFGLSCSTVITASMQPEIKVGSIVYFEPVDPATLKPGDIIVFRTSYGTDVTDVTHRVVENRYTEKNLITRGDANPNNDFSPVAYDLVCGIVRRSLPFGGNLALFLTSVKGKQAMAGLFIPAVLFWIAGNTLDPHPQRRKTY